MRGPTLLYLDYIDEGYVVIRVRDMHDFEIRFVTSPDGAQYWVVESYDAAGNLLSIEDIKATSRSHAHPWWGPRASHGFRSFNAMADAHIEESMKTKPPPISYLYGLACTAVPIDIKELMKTNLYMNPRVK